MTAVRQITMMQASVVAADDARILQIVALVDGMPERGAADDLVAPLRARLAVLHPPRPVSFTRLLFTPLDPLIVPAPAWRRAGLSFPRTAIIPIANALREIIGPEAARLDVEGRAGPMGRSQVAKFSASIWPRAASALDTMPVPANWLEATGLPAGDYRPMADIIAAVLGVATDIQALALHDGTPPEEPIRTVLGRTAPRGSFALSAVVAVLLARIGGIRQTMTLGTEAAGSNPSKAMDAAIEYTLDRLQASLDIDSAIGSTMAQASTDSARVAELLHELESSAAARPERKRRIDRLRRAADTLCRSRFEMALQTEFLDRLHTLPPEPSDGAVEALEATAHGLRRLETQGNALGGADSYGGLLQACLEPLRHSSVPLRLEDRVRLVEILLGSREALTLLT